VTADLVAFLRARYDEDEDSARAAFSGQCDPENGWGLKHSHGSVTITPHVGVIHEQIQAAHVVRWNPARVLREGAARRAILEAFRIADVSGQVLPDDRNIGEADGLEEALRHLATVYDDHPDYQAAWRP
jgi:uncharacterized protein DUF6221